MRRVVRCETVSYPEWSPRELLESSLAAGDPASTLPTWRTSAPMGRLLPRGHDDLTR